MNSWRISYTRLREHPGRAAAVLAVVTVLLAVCSLCLGAVELHPVQVFTALWRPGTGDVATHVVLYSRLPRTCGSLLAGSALAVAGVLIQTVLANPLAAPHIIGVNSGAALGVTLCCALLPATSLQPLAAFAGAMAGVLLVLLFAEATGASRITLALAGVAISSIFSALIDAVITFYPDALMGYSDFRMGGLDGVTMDKLAPAALLASLFPHFLTNLFPSAPTLAWSVLIFAYYFESNTFKSSFFSFQIIQFFYLVSFFCGPSCIHSI